MLGSPSDRMIFSCVKQCSLVEMFDQKSNDNLITTASCHDEKPHEERDDGTE